MQRTIFEKLPGGFGRLLLVLGVIAAGLVLTACGSSSDSTTSSTEAKTDTSESPDNPVSAAVEDALAPNTEFPGPSTSPEPESGKKVVVVTCNMTSVCKTAAEGASEAGETLGWNVKVVDGKSDPAVWNQAIEGAIVDNADGIVLDAVVPALVAPALEKAKAAGIAVTTIWTAEPAATAPGTPPGSVYGSVVSPFVQDGETMADWVTEDSDGTAQILQLIDPSFPELKARNDSFAAQIKKVCAGCTDEIVKFSIPNAPQSLPQAVVSALQANPKIDYIVAPIDPAVLFVAQGVRQAGKAGDVKVVSFEGDPDALQRIADGELQVADGAHPGQWAGYQALDLLNRAFAGEAEMNLEIPARLFDESNVDTIDFENGWQGDVDFRQRYQELWGK